MCMHRYTPTLMEQPSRALWGSVSCPARACTVLCATVSGKIELDLHFVLVSSVLTVSQRNLNEKMKIETKQPTRNLGAPFSVIFCVSEEDISILM